MHEIKNELQGTGQIHLENRKQLSVTGVHSVKSFDENTVNVVTELGALTVKGKDLHITVFATESGNLAVEGRIDALGYSSDRDRGGFFGHLLK